MSVHPSWSPLFDFPGWVIKEIKTRPEIAMIRLQRDKRFSIRCPYCYKRSGTNRKVWQSVSDLPLGIASIVKIHYEAIQGFCACCERYFTIVPHGFDHAVRATRRLMHYVCRLCRFMPADNVAEFLPISASTARRLGQEGACRTPAWAWFRQFTGYIRISQTSISLDIPWFQG